MKKFTFLKTLVGGLIAGPVVLNAATYPSILKTKNMALNDHFSTIEFYSKGRLITWTSSSFNPNQEYSTFSNCFFSYCVADTEKQGISLEGVEVVFRNFSPELPKKLPKWGNWKLVLTNHPRIYKIAKA